MLRAVGLALLAAFACSCSEEPTAAEEMTTRPEGERDASKSGKDTEEAGNPHGLTNTSDPGELADLPFAVPLIDLPGDAYNFFFAESGELTWRGVHVDRRRFDELLDSFVRLDRKKRKRLGKSDKPAHRPILVLHPWKTTKWSALLSWMNGARRRGWSVCYVRGRPKSYQPMRKNS